MVTDSRYYMNGAPNTCAFCSRPFAILQGARQCYRGDDNRYYCSSAHAERGQEESLGRAEQSTRRVS